MSINRIGTYILDADGNPKEELDTSKWAAWMEITERHVADETIGDARISTVFLGLDHGFGTAQPVLYETMVFGGPFNEEQRRYCSRDEALAGHAEMVARVKESE